MSKFAIPTRGEVSPQNQELFDQLQKKIGFVPNLYAYFAKNESALGDFLNFQGRKNTLSAREKEAINLITSQINGCSYCLSAHTALAKMNGFTDQEVLGLRNGEAPFDKKLNALVKLSSSIVFNRGKVSEEAKHAFFDAGYSEANLIDVSITVGEKTISNYIHNLAGFEIDFPLAQELASEVLHH